MQTAGPLHGSDGHKIADPKTALALFITFLLNTLTLKQSAFFHMLSFLRKLSDIISIPGDVLSEGGLGLKIAWT